MHYASLPPQIIMSSWNYQLIFNLNDHILDKMGVDQNIVSNKNVDGTNGESGISTIILYIKPNWGDKLQNLVNINSIPLTNSTTLLIPI